MVLNCCALLALADKALRDHENGPFDRVVKYHAAPDFWINPHEVQRLADKAFELF